jgi:hypothetical protein
VNYLRFPVLKDRDIVRNWTTLGRLINEQGFPPGIRIGAQARAWREDEVEAWLESRRIAPPSASTVAKDTAVRTFAPAASVNAVRPPPSPRGVRAEPRGKPDRPRSQLEAANK